MVNSSRHLALAGALLLVSLQSLAADHLYSLENGGSNRTILLQQASESLKAILEEKTSQHVTLITLNAALLTEDRAEIALPLDKNRVVVAQKFQVDRTSNGQLIWHGRLEDGRHRKGRAVDLEKETPVDELNAVMLVRNGDKVTGSIRARGQLYQVLPVGNGEHAIVKVDTSKYPEDVVLPDDTSTAAQQPPTRSSTAPASNLSIVRVLLVFTRQAQAKFADPEGLAALMIAEANQGMVNSGIPIVFENAGVLKTHYEEPSGGAGYSQMLNDITSPTNAELGAIVSPVRDQARADLVMLVATNNTYCGTAWLNVGKSRAFGVTSCTLGNFTFAHEMGHNFGVDHNSTVPAGPYGDAFGYQQNKVTPSWRTIMSTDCSVACPRLNYWSNPDKTYNGVPMGIPGINNSARVLNLRRDVVADFYPPVNGLPPAGYLELPLEVESNQSFVAHAVASDEIGSPLSFRWNADGFIPNHGTTASLPLKASAVTHDTLKTIHVEVFNTYGSVHLNKTLMIKALDSPPVGTCVTPWVSSKAYASTIEQVSYGGYNYQVAHWSQNARPDLNFVETGAAKPWLRLGTCGGEQLVAKITGPSTVEVGKGVLLSGASSTGQGLRLAWTANAFSPPASTQPADTFMAPNTVGVRSITLTVTDARGMTATANHSLNVTAGTPVNRPPVGNLTGNETVESAKAVTFTANTSDPDGNPMTYTWTRPAGFTGNTGNNRSVTLIAPVVSSDTLATVSVSVSDGHGGVLRLHKPITVKAPPTSGNCRGIPAWSATKVYSTHAESVSYNGMIYKQNFYNINKRPADHAAAYGKEWQNGVPCPVKQRR